MFPMFMPWITTTQRTPQAARGNADAAAAAEVVSSQASLDASWEAIVAQLRATPAEGHANEPDPPEYEWVGRLGVHINRPPKRSRR